MPREADTTLAGHVASKLGTEKIRVANEARFEARWKLGRLLKQIDRAAGPGRGKKNIRPVHSFKAFIAALDPPQGKRTDLRLLDQNRWKKCGEGFKDVNKFLRSLRMEDFKLATETRKKIATKIKALQPKASNRAIAKAIGADERTVRRDAANAALGKKNASKSKGGGAANAALSGAEIAKLGQKQEDKGAKEQERKKERESFEARRDKGARVGDLIAMAEGGEKFGVIYADPPWEFKVYSNFGRSPPEVL
jgi:hypothetical protein